MAEPKKTLEKKQFIIDLLIKNSSKYVDIENDDAKIIDNIYHLFSTGEMVHVTTPIEYLYYGWYFHHVTKDYIKMKYYYLLAIEGNEMHSTHNMANYYKTIKKNDKKYLEYLIAGAEKHSYTALTVALEYKYRKE